MDDLLDFSFEKWAKIRSKGRNRFVWIRYVLVFGVFFASLLIIGDIFLFTWHPIKALTTAVIFPLVGYIGGTLTWRKNESIYSRDSEARDQPDA